MCTALSENAAAIFAVPFRSTAVLSARALASTLFEALTLTRAAELTVTLLPIWAVLLTERTSTEALAAIPTLLPPPPDWPVDELLASPPLFCEVLVVGAPLTL